MPPARKLLPGILANREDPRLSRRLDLDWALPASRSEPVRKRHPQARNAVKEHRDFELIDLAPAERIDFAFRNDFAGTKINTLGMATGRRAKVSVAVFRDVYLLYETRGFAIFDEDGVSRFSTGLPLIDIGKIDAFEPVGRGLFCGDMFNADNICHFSLDHMGRALLYRKHFPECLPVFLPKSSIEYNEILRDTCLGAWSGLEPGVVYRFDELHVLSSSLQPINHPARYCDRTIMQGVVGPVVLPPRDPDWPAKIYISRSDARFRRIVNEEKIIELLVGEGFKVLRMSDFRPFDQWGIFRNATDIVAPHGAALTSLIFSSPGANVVELLNPQKGTAAFSVIAQERGLNYRAVFGAPAGGREDYAIPVEAVAAAMGAA